MTDNTKNLLLFGLGILWAMKSSKKAYAPTITRVGTITPKKPKKPRSQADCEDGKVFKAERQLQVNCIMAPCPPLNIPAQCITPPKDRVSSNQALRNKVGNWTPNDTSCTPCTTKQYQGNRATARIHKSWCDLNCAAEIRKANQSLPWYLSNPFRG